MVSDVKPGGVFLLDCPWTEAELDEKLPGSVKSYIANNNVNFYVIDATGTAMKLGNVKVKNTVLQSAFFSLAKVLPAEEAIEYMKKMAYKSYSKKGEAIVNLNYAAIDAGAGAAVKVNVPVDWKTAEKEAAKAPAEGNRADLVNFVNNIARPVNAMKGDSLPVSAFKDCADGTYPQGASAYDKRGVAVKVPVWHAENCIQCNQCSYVCPHAAIRPFAMSADEAAKAPACTKFTAKMMGKGCEDYKFTIAVSPLDCMGCSLCVNVCPTKPEKRALEMVLTETQLDQQPAFDYAVNNVTKKATPFADTTVKGSQFNQPLLQFSGSCAGCAETTYARLITQLFGEKMYISNATGCSSIWGGSAPSTPYTVNNESGHGPAWANSLFEDNAEHGLGMLTAVKHRRAHLADVVKALIAVEYCDADIKAAGAEWLEKMDTGAYAEAGKKVVAG